MEDNLAAFFHKVEAKLQENEAKWQEEMQAVTSNVEAVKSNVEATAQKIEELKSLRNTDKLPSSITASELYEQFTNKQQIPLWFNPKKPPRPWTDAFLKAECEVGTGEQHGVQPKFLELLGALKQEQQSVILIDRHTVSSIGTRRPDAVGYLAGFPPSELALAFFVELKAVKKDGFEPKDKGQVLDFAMKLLKLSPLRQHVDFLLLDLHHALFFRLIKGEPSSTLQESSLLHLEEALPYIYALCMMTAVEHGMDVPAIPKEIQISG